MADFTFPDGSVVERVPHREPAQPERMCRGRLWNDCRKKARYPTEAQANRYAKRRQADGAKLRVYYCSDCGGWHLTRRGAGE